MTERIQSDSSIRVEAPETELFDPNTTVIITTTRYKNWQPGEVDISNPDKVRGNAALDSFTQAMDMGVRTVVVDGGSSDQFLAQLDNLGIAHYPEGRGGMSAGRLQALDIASQLPGSKWNLWMEPEKTSLVHSVPHIIGTMESQQAAIGVPGRNDELFAQTYPDYQYRSESFANMHINRVAHGYGVLPEAVDFDWFFGPKVYANTPEVRALFDNPPVLDMAQVHHAREAMDPRKYFNFLFLPLLRGLQQGQKVIPIPDIPFEYPDIQRQNEMLAAGANLEAFMAKRRQQAAGIKREVLHYLEAVQPRLNGKSAMITGQ